MRTASFPTHAEMLDEFAAGMREHKAKQAREAITVSPYLTRRAETYLEAMARINEQRG